MADPFESPLFLLEQTKSNLQQFDAECPHLFSSGAQNVVETDPRSGIKTYKVKFIKEIPRRLRHIAGTAINDLRHALDQAAVASVRAITGGEANRLYFPFATTPADLQGRLDRGFPAQIHPTFLGFETYPTSEKHVGGDDFLDRFSRASGPNKHRITCKVGGQISRFHGDSIQGEGFILEMRIPPVWDIDKNELIIGTAAPTGHIRYSFDISFYLALAEAGPLTGAPASATLHALLKKVESIVSAIRTDTARIIKHQ